MQKITPCLWFDQQAEEAVRFYTSLFKNSKTGLSDKYDESSSEVSGQPKGSVMTVEFELEGQEFLALNGGPLFKFSPAVSFFVNCETEEEINTLWEKLSEGGLVMMEFQKYPFSEKYGWLSDKFGVSWQLSLAKGSQKITPALLFVGAVNGKAEEAMNFYTSLFKNSSVKQVERYMADEGDTEGHVKYGVFNLEGQNFIAMDSGFEHAFAFSEAISFIVNCENQAEVDAFWNAFTKDGEESQCGWLKDKYGLSWQIVPTILNQLLRDKDPAKAEKTMKAMLEMKKLDVAALKEAHDT